MELRKFVAPEFVYGVSALTLTGRYAKNFGANKALVVTDPGLIRAGWVDKTLCSLDAADIPYAVFDGVTPNPKDHEVAAGARVYQDQACDVIVAVGGGSPMDCAKGIGIASTNQRAVLELVGVDEVPIPGPPLICVPTTAGTAADVSQFAIITDAARGQKAAIISKAMVPDVSLIDPETTTTMVAELTAATGLDALIHAIEAYVSNAASPITDLNALAAIPLLTRNLVAAIAAPQCLEFRSSMMLGSLLAGLAFSNASLGLVHAMAHSVGGLLDSPHGVTNTLLLDYVVAFNYPAAADRYDQIAHAMGLEQEPNAGSRQDTLLRRLAQLRQDAGIGSLSLAALGVRAADIPRLAQHAYNDPCIVTNPREASIQDIEELYERAL